MTPNAMQPNEQLLDRQMIGENIRFMRHVKGLTQTELAVLSGVTKVTIYYAETGKPVRRQTLKKIADAFDIGFDEMLSTEVMRHMISKKNPQVFHAAEDAAWYRLIDLRKNIPPDNQEKIQDSLERSRLGHLGLVPYFWSHLSFIMPEGPGMIMIEFYGAHAFPKNLMYADWIAYCVQGELRVEMCGKTYEMKKGDALGYMTEALSVEPLHPLGPNDPPAIMMWVGANRMGRFPNVS
jgi:transcriptional regulator with XRE-family HTH domain